MFLKKHWTFSKIPRDVFFKTTVSFFSGFYPIFYTKKGCIKNVLFDAALSLLFCGKTGIRTLGTVTRSPHFECGPIDHSGIFPYLVAKIMEKSVRLFSVFRFYFGSDKCLCIAAAARLPSPIANITVAPPRTISPPAKIIGIEDSISSLTTMVPLRPNSKPGIE